MLLHEQNLQRMLNKSVQGKIYFPSFTSFFFILLSICLFVFYQLIKSYILNCFPQKWLLGRVSLLKFFIPIGQLYQTAIQKNISHFVFEILFLLFVTSLSLKKFLPFKSFICFFFPSWIYFLMFILYMLFCTFLIDLLFFLLSSLFPCFYFNLFFSLFILICILFEFLI